MSFNTFYLNSENQSGIIDGSNVVVGGRMGVSMDPPQYTLDVSGTSRSTNLIATTATITNLDISGDTVDITSLQTKVENTQLVLLTVVVASKTSNAANSGGSSSGYFINNIETPYLHLTIGKTYRFDQSDSTNSSHPILFYLDEDKTSQYNTGITTSGTAGSSGAYVEIAVTESTPSTLYYQCQNHSYMGNKSYIKASNVTSITSVGTITAGTWNAVPINKQYIDTQSISINDLSNVVYNPSAVNEGQTLVWNPTTQTWVPGTIALETLPSSIYLNGGKSKVMEKIAGVCDGRTISGENANYILETVSTYQDISTSLVDIEGSSITYSPPTNASQVVYTFTFNIVDISNEASMFNQSNDLTVRFYIDGTEVSNQTAQISSYLYNNGSTYTYSAIIDIGSVSNNDISNGKLLSWSMGKTLKLMASNSEADYPIRIFAIKTVSSNQYISEFIPPTLQVTSIGNLNTYPFENTTINDLSDVSFNSASTTDGQALVWNATDAVWEAGVVASSGGGGGLTDLSASSISDLSDVSLNGIQINQTLKWDGEKLVPTTLATTDTKQGQILETLAGVCDGRTVVVESGSYTLPNVTTSTTISNTTYDLIPGSSIDYTPPIGSTAIIYEFTFTYGREVTNNTSQWTGFEIKLYLDDIEVTNANTTMFGDNIVRRDSYKWTFKTDGSSNDTANGIVTSWNSSKNIKLKAKARTSCAVHRSEWSITGADNTDEFVIPTVQITAIGETSGQAVTLTNNSVSDLSDISFNSSTTTDGQSLVWNSTDGVWEAGTVASSGGVSSGDDISFNNLDISGVLGTNKSNNEIKLGAHIIPTTNSTYDLGSAEYKIRHLFLSSNSLWVGDDHKIEISDGKMKFRKLQKDTLPSGLSGIPGASLEDAVAVLGKTPGSNASTFSLADWEAYSIAKGNPLKIDDIFQADDINDDDGLTDTISSSDISFNVVDASGLNVFGTASMQSIIPPITNTYSLGSATHVWKDVYIGPGSLYIDGQKVLESDADTIVVGADANQNLKLNTTGTGVLQIESAAGIQISSTGAGNVELGSTGTGIVRITDNLALNGNVEIFNDSSDMVKINDSLMVTGDISFNGNLYQNGTLFTGGSTIDETTDVSLNNLIVHGDLSANDASFNVIDATSLRINGVDIIDGAPAALDTLSELAAALDNSANFATNVLTTLSNKQDTLTAGTNITITGNTISASGGGGSGLTDLSATSISDLSDVSFNSTSTTDGATLAWNTSEQLWKPSNVTNTIGVNLVNVSSGTTATYTAPKSSPGVEIQSLRVSITPTAMDSVIELNWKVFCDGYRNIGFRVTRNINGSDVLVYDDEKNHNGSFLAMVTFDETGTTSTQTSPQVVPISWFDEPNTTSEVTYKLWVGNSWNSTETITINKNHNSTDGDGREYGVSTVAAIEHPKTKTLVPATSITKQGQVLEILYGFCDGSSVEVESGTYTMPSLPSHRSDGVNNVSTTTYTKDEASEITYTAPPGTDRIEFKFTEYLHSDNTSWIMLYILCIDDVEIDNTETLERPGMYAVGAYTLTATITSNETDLTQSHKYYFKLKHGETHPFKYGPLETVSPIWGLQSNDGFIPKLKITAIGESSGQAVTLTNNSVSDLSDISFNSTSTTDGQALVWNSTDGVWEAGAVASSGGSTIDQTTDVSLNNLIIHGDLSGSNDILLNGRITIAKEERDQTPVYDTEYQITFSGGNTYNNWILYNTSNSNGGNIPVNTDWTIEYSHKITIGNGENHSHFAIVLKEDGISSTDFGNNTYFMYYATFPNSLVFRYKPANSTNQTDSIPSFTWSSFSEFVDVKWEYTTSNNTMTLYFNGIIVASISNLTNSSKIYGTWGFGEWNDNTHHLINPRITHGGTTYTITTVNSTSSTAPTVSTNTTNTTILYAMDVSGKAIFSDSVTANGSVLSSDDRIKHNEQPITNALSTISKITPKHYFKTKNTLYDADHHFPLNSQNQPISASGTPLILNKDYTIETGIIAQEIKAIPELSFAVQNTTPLGVDYNSIHCTHIAATKELHQLVQSQQTTIEEQQNDIEHLKLVNQDINTQLNTALTELQTIKHYLGI